MTSYPQAIEEAILRLDLACDGARTRDGSGFDGADANFGKSMADQIRASRWPTGQRLSPRQFPHAVRMVHKYRAQLTRMGVTIPEPKPIATVDEVRAPIRQPVAPRRHYAAAPVDPMPAMPPILRPAGLVTDTGHVMPAARVTPTPKQPTTPFEMLDLIMATIKAQMPNFEERPSQRRAIEDIIRAITGEADWPDFVGEIGTGGGKTFILVVAHLCATFETRQPAIIATLTKALQMQYRKDLVWLQEILADVRPFKAAEVKGRRNYVCLKLFEDKLAEYEQTGEVGFRTPEAAAQFIREIVGWVKSTDRGDIEDAPFEWEPAAKAELTAGRDECAGKNCRLADVCYANRAIAAGGKADIVIGNTHLVGEHMRIYAETEGHAGVIPLGIKPRCEEDDESPEPDVEETAKPIMYFDECHGIEDVLRSVLGREVTRSRVVYVAGRVQHFTSDHKTVRAALRAEGQARLGAEDQADAEGIIRSAQIWKARTDLVVTTANRAFDTWRRRITEAKKSTIKLGDEADIARPLHAALDDLRSAVKDQTPRWLDPSDEPMWNRLAKQIGELQRDLNAVAQPSDPDVYIRYMELETTPEDSLGSVTLYSMLISVAERLREILWSTYPHVIAVSATIAGPEGLDHWRRRVGASDTEEMVVPAPFDYPRQSLLYLPPTAKLLDPRREARNMDTLRGRAYLAEFIGQTEALVNMSGGGAFLLFTSNAAIAQTYNGLRAKSIAGQTPDQDVELPEVVGLADRLGSQYLLLRQGQYPRPELVRMVKEDGNAVLLGTKSFWEGVDVPGEALRLVVINAFPFAPPDDPVWDAICEAVDREAGEEMAWFRQLAVPTATVALKQGFGRLIRTQSDWGVVAILDGRASITPYGRDIIRALPPARQTRNIDDVRRFYEARRAR